MRTLCSLCRELCVSIIKLISSHFSSEVAIQIFEIDGQVSLALCVCFGDLMEAY